MLYKATQGGKPIMSKRMLKDKPLPPDVAKKFERDHFGIEIQSLIRVFDKEEPPNDKIKKESWTKMREATRVETDPVSTVIS
jgi:hypothetical protein